MHIFNIHSPANFIGTFVHQLNHEIIQAASQVTNTGFTQLIFPTNTRIVKFWTQWLEIDSKKDFFQSSTSTSVPTVSLRFLLMA